ncbi:MAG: hypothetical protein AAFY26_27180 [Cyanobacteria bacterium J06638_22]
MRPGIPEGSGSFRYQGNNLPILPTYQPIDWQQTTITTPTNQPTTITTPTNQPTNQPTNHDTSTDDSATAGSRKPTTPRKRNEAPQATTSLHI